MSDRGERNVGIRPWQWGGGSVSHCSSGPRAYGDGTPPNPLRVQSNGGGSGPPCTSFDWASFAPNPTHKQDRRGGRTDDVSGGQTGTTDVIEPNPGSRNSKPAKNPSCKSKPKKN